MPFSKAMLIGVICAFSAQAQVVDTTWIDENQKKQKAYLEELKQKGQLDMFHPDAVAEKTQKYHKQSQQIGTNSIKAQTFESDQYAGLYDSDKSQIQDGKVILPPDEVKALFVSFSMSDRELKEAFIAASEHGAEVYINGLHPDDDNIGLTLRRFRELGADIENKPSARFHPKAFEEFNVQSVPFMISMSKGKVLSVSGLLNMSWLDEQGENEKGRIDFGIQGPTKPVIERSLLDDIQLKLSRVDFDAKKKAAVDNFWKKRDFVSLPQSRKSESWFIDPTVKVTSDIVNSQGDVLARKGDIINPLASVPALNTYVLFNARDIKQLQWADKQRNSGTLVGTVMFMSSELDKENGWDHLSTLRKHFKQEIYLLPKEMVERFNITSLPVIVSTDLNRKMLKVEQFAME
jgi:conjugal transfer pilus assembly protein TraW